jgi:hypothetical protein
MTEQKQKGGDNSLLVQGQVVHLHQGLSAKDVIVLAETVIRSNLPTLAQEAADTALSRADALIQDTVQKALEQKITDFSNLSKPRKQNDLLQAQKGYAFSDGNPDLKAVLTDLLLATIQDNTEQSLNSISISEAIAVASKLTANQIKLITLIYAFSRVIYFNFNSHDDLIKTFIKILESVDAKNLIFTELHILHLEFLSCVALESFMSNNLERRIKITYPGLFSLGYTLEDISKDVPKSLVSLCLNDPSKFQIGALNKETLDIKMAQLNIDIPTSEKLRVKLTENLMNDAAIIHLINKKSPELSDFIKKWNESSLMRCRLSTVAAFIGHSYMAEKSLINHELKLD